MEGAAISELVVRLPISEYGGGLCRMQSYLSMGALARAAISEYWGTLDGAAVLKNGVLWRGQPYLSIGGRCRVQPYLSIGGRWQVQPFRSMGGEGGRSHFVKLLALAGTAISKNGGHSWVQSVKCIRGAGGCRQLSVRGAGWVSHFGE
jgi:hypothetical protein